jgi:hypothetical protein
MKWITSGGPIRAESLADALGPPYDKPTYRDVEADWPTDIAPSIGAGKLTAPGVS